MRLKPVTKCWDCTAPLRSTTGLGWFAERVVVVVVVVVAAFIARALLHNNKNNKKCNARQKEPHRGFTFFSTRTTTPSARRVEENGADAMMQQRLSDASELYGAHGIDFPYEGGRPRWFNAVFHLLERRARVVLGFWMCALLVGAFVGPSFLRMGDDAWNAPKGTRAYPAQQMFNTRFPTQSHELPMMVLITSATGDVRAKAMFEFNAKLKRDVLEYNATAGNVLAYTSYYDMAGTLLDGAKSEFINADGKATFINIMVRGDQVSSKRYKFVKRVRRVLAEHNPDDKLYEIGLTGVDAMSLDSADDNAKNVMRIDVVTMPFALGLLGYMIKSWRLLLVSCFNLGVSILFSFSVMAAVVDLGLPPPETSSAQLMEVMVMAVSIDWSLFMHRRFRDEIKRGVVVREAAYLALLHSGHVILMSGATLFIVFTGFALMPAQTVQMDGACCAVGVLTAMAVALTNNVAFYLALPNFSGDFDPRCCKATTVKDLERELTQLQQSATAPLIADDTPHVMYFGPRFRFTRWVTRFPNNLAAIALVYVLVVPLAVAIKDMDINQNILSAMPRNSAAARTFRRSFESFPGGQFSPFYVLIASPAQRDGAVRSPVFFNAAGDVAEAVLAASMKHDKRFTADLVSSPAFADGHKIGLLEALSLLGTSRSLACKLKHVPRWDWAACSLAREFALDWEQSVNDREDAMLVRIVVPFFPFAQESSAYIDVLYDALDDLEQRHAGVVQLYLCGFEVGFNALMHKVFKLFPLLIVSTFAIVFAVLGFLLRSAFVPLRLLLTLVAPLAAVFGAGTLVYQDGWLVWTHLDTFHRMDGLFWYIPILLLCALACFFNLKKRLTNGRSHDCGPRAGLRRAVNLPHHGAQAEWLRRARRHVQSCVRDGRHHFSSGAHHGPCLFRPAAERSGNHERVRLHPDVRHSL